MLIKSSKISFAQTISKANPVIFSELLIGHSEGKTGGFTGGAALNYQKDKSLLTARFLATVKLKLSFLNPFIPIPAIDQKSDLEEFSLLYGRRFIKDSKAFSFSLGPSYNIFTEVLIDSGFRRYEKISKYPGASFEANIKWFKKEKNRYRIYGLIPVGKPTGFGNGIGFKISGSLARESYAGIGITFGFGFHKIY